VTARRAIVVDETVLDAAMVARALDELDPPLGALVLIENVGNLVCPALFDLGEAASVPEGDDEPTKYPHLFRAADLAVLNKIDLAPHVAFAQDRWLARARAVHPDLAVLPLSATRGDGLEAWYGWLRARPRRGGGAGIVKHSVSAPSCATALPGRVRASGDVGAMSGPTSRRA
jgi:hydrogenase accessory protein HypB